MKHKAKYIIGVVLIFLIGTGLFMRYRGSILEKAEAAEAISENTNESEVSEQIEETTIGEKAVEEVEEPEEKELSAKTQRIISELEALSAEYKDNISIYYYNLDSNEEYFQNKDQYFVSASLKKLPQIMQVLDKVQAGELSMDTMVQYIEARDFETGTGILQREANLQTVSIERLVELSITESDNIAYNMLKRTCDDTLLDYVENKIGVENILREDYTKLTAEQSYKILYELYTNKDNNPYYEWVLELMKETAFHDRLDKYLPYDKVAHKIGSYYRYYHDMGIIYGKEKYILVIMTKDIGQAVYHPDFTIDDESMVIEDWGKKASDLIADMSKKVYDIIEE